MLRASSLGLSLPLPTIFAVQSCRRLYGARSKLASPRARNASNSNSSVALAKSAHTQSGVAHLSPSTPADTYHQHQEHEDAAVQEEIRVVHMQQQQLQALGEDVREGGGGAILSALSVSSVSVAAEDKIGLPTSETLEAEKNTKTPANIDRTSTEDSLIAEGEGTGPSPGKSPEAPKRRVITDPPPYAAGKPWLSDSVKPVTIPNETLHFLKNIERGVEVAHRKYAATMKAKLRTRWKKRTKRQPATVAVVEEPEEEQQLEELPPPRELPSLIREHMETLGTTSSVDQAWDSYVYLIDTIASHPMVYSRIKHVPYAHLHRFSRLLAHNRPRTYVQYLRLLSVMTYIVHCGGTLKQAQWNTLIDHVASGRRKTTPEDVERAMDVFRGMKTGRLPGSSLFRIPQEGEEEELSDQSPLGPDVYTVTTLLAIAARAMDAETLKSVANAMAKAGLAPNRITHLSLLRYFTDKKDLGGVRRTLQKMRHQDLELGLDGLNACIWAYGNNNRLDIVLLIYRALRHNKIPEKYLGPDDIHDTVCALREESIFVEKGLVPNAVTYTAIIQTMAYHGYFEPSIKVFIDMLSIENVEQGAPLFPSESGDLIPGPYTPSAAVYRGIFLGFARHGIPPHLDRDPEAPDWTMQNLFEIFERFLGLPKETILTHSVLDVIMSAFARTSANDRETMRKAWTALDDRFGIIFHKQHYDTRLLRLRRQLFPDDQSKLG